MTTLPDLFWLFTKWFVVCYNLLLWLGDLVSDLVVSGSLWCYFYVPSCFSLHAYTPNLSCFSVSSDGLCWPPWFSCASQPPNSSSLPLFASSIILVIHYPSAGRTLWPLGLGTHIHPVSLELIEEPDRAGANEWLNKWENRTGSERMVCLFFF